MALVRNNGQWTINGQTWADVEASAYTKALANPGLNSTEIWEIQNDSGGWHHPLHIHLIDFRILDREFDRNGIRVPPKPHELGPKDVVYVGENERVRLIMKFGPHARPVHDPLPQPGSRGPRHDGPVLGRRRRRLRPGHGRSVLAAAGPGALSAMTTEARPTVSEPRTAPAPRRLADSR